MKSLNISVLQLYCIVALAIALTPTTFYAQNIPFTQKTYDVWVDMRVGDGSKPTWWYCFGEVYSYPDGELVARMQGVDVATLVRISKDSVIQLNRKIFIYIDKTTGKVLETYNGQPVSHIEYPYQQITYALSGDKLATYVTQGKGKRVMTMGPGYKTTARQMGNGYAFSSPVFLQFPLPNGEMYEAVENYDFLVNPKAQRAEEKYQLTWYRYGELAPFFGKNKKGVINLVCYRVGSFEQLPEPLQSYIRTKAPLWMKPPQDLKEIAQLQQE
jgi:hypothetical protein